MRKIYVVLGVFAVLFGMSFSASSQTPLTNLGTDINGTYTNYTNTVYGSFKQTRVQETSNTSSGTRKWEFNSDGYFNTWRASAAGQTISGFNTFITPASGTASAYWRNNTGGVSGYLPATTSGNYYTFNVNYSGTTYQNQNMEVLETSFNPVTISSVTKSAPSGTTTLLSTQSATITVTTSSAPASGENVFVRYTTNAYTSSALAAVTFVGTTGTATIPAQAGGSTVSYYVFSSPKSSAQIGTDVSANGQSGYDLAALNLNNNSGSNYTYSVTSNNVLVVSGGGTGSPSTSYATVAAAITAINGGTVHTGTITCYVNSGYSETAPAATGFSLTATGTAANPITFIKTGSGTNPTLNAATGVSNAGSAAPDGIFALKGSDYVTIDGFTFTDGNSGSSTVAMEFGVGLFKASAGNGCNNNTIQNCTFNMQRINNSSATAPLLDGAVAIEVINATASAATTPLTPTNGGTLATNGTNSANKFYSNTINGGNIGIGFNGYAATVGIGPAPTATTFLGDLSNDVGGTGASGATTGNTILNFGGGGASNPAAGIRANNQWSLNVGNNSINNNNGSGVNHGTTLRGIYLQAGKSGNTTCTWNTITLKSGGTTSGTYGIDNSIGTTAAANTITISNNIIQNCTYTGATTATFYGISTSATATNIITSSNQIINNAIGTSGVTSTPTLYGIYNQSGSTNFTANSNTISNNTLNNTNGSIYCLQGSTSTLSYDGNTISNNTIPNSAGSSSSIVIGFYDGSSPASESYTNNTISNLSISGTSTATAHLIAGIENNTATGTKIFTGNNINNLSFTSSGAGYASVFGLYDLYSTTNTISKNVIHGLSSTGTTPFVIGMYLGVTSGTTFNVSNNIIGNLTTPGSTGLNLFGIYTSSAATNINFYYNTIYLNGTSTGSGFGSSCIYQASTTPTLTLNNNLLVNLSTATGTGLTTCFTRPSASLTSYASTSNNNLFYAGIASASNLLYYDGTNSVQTLSAYKSLVTPRESASVSETVSSTAGTYFQSLTGPSSGSPTTFLHLVNGLTTLAESGGATISGYTDDYDAQTRNVSTPDIGADEFTGTVPPSMTYVSSSAVQQTGSVCAGSSNTAILRMDVVTTGSVNPLTVSSITINGNGTSNFGDVSTYRIYYTGTSSTFATTTPFSAAASSLISSDIVVMPSGTTTLASGTNYFWLVYNTNTTATGPSLDGEFKSIALSTGGGSATTSAPLGVVTLNAKPTVTVSPTSGTYCNGGTAVTLTGGGASTYAWSPATGLSATTGTSVTASPTSAQSYTVTGTDGNGCTNTAISAIAVGTNPTNVTATATPSTICSGGTSALTSSGYAQNTASLPASYTFAGATGSYAVISGTAVAGAIGDDVGTGSLPIGFTFNYNGIAQTVFAVSSNGLIQLGAASMSGLSTNALASTANIIAPLWDDNNTTGGSVQYLTTGSAGNHVLTVQWTGMHVGNTGGSGQPTIDMQLQLFEATGAIKFVYGSTSTALTSTGATIGISGASGNYLSVTPAATPSSSTVSSSTENSTISSAANFPTGTTYTFTPPSVTLTYLWAVATDVASSTNQNTNTIALTAPESFTVTVSNGGCSAQAIAAVTVATGVSIGTHPASISKCVNATATFTVAATGAGLGYAWYESTNGGGSWSPLSNTGIYSGTGIATLTLTGVSIGMNGYKYECIVSSSCGSPTTSNPATLTVNVLPTVTATPSSATYCGVTGVTINAGGASTYAWSPATGLSATTGASVVASPTSAQTYTVTGTDGNGCINTAPSAIAVGTTPVNVTATATPSTICSGGTSALTSSGFAQNTASLPASYNFAGATGTYVAISGTALANGVGDDVGNGNLPIGFNFIYNGATHTVFSAGSNGTIILDDVTASYTSGYPRFNGLATSVNYISPLWDDNNTTGGSIQYLTTGTTGNHILTVQWTGMHVGNGGSPSQPTIDMQLQIFEATGAIKFIYGSTSGAFSTTTASIGISGASGNYLSVTPAATPSSSTVSSSTENASISSAANFPTGTTYTFTPPSLTLTYLWAVAGDVASSTSQNTNTIALTAPESFTVTISNGGCSAQAIAAVAVASGISIGTHPANTSKCVNGTATFTVAATGAGLGYAWYESTNGGGSWNPLSNTGIYSGTGIATLTLTGVTAGMNGYQYECTISSSCGSPTTSNPATLTVNGLPTVTATPSSATYCGVTGVTITAGGASTYAWSPSTGLSATTGTSVVASPTSAQSYTVTGTDGNGCTNMAISAIAVGTNPTNVTATATPSTICSGGTSALTSSGYAQNTASLPASYTFAGATGSYAVISGTAVAGAIGDDVGTGSLPIGFTFNYNGIAQTVFAVSSNGLIQLGATTMSGLSTNALASTANIIAPLWDDNNTTGGSVQYLTTGSAGNHVLTVQWTGMHVGNTGGSGQPTIDMQLQLFEATGAIKFVYGSTSTTLTSTGATIGISGASGNYLSVTPAATPSSSTVSSSTENSTISSAANFPTGTTYTFTPPSVTLTYLWAVAGDVASSTSQNTNTIALTAPESFTVTVSNGGCSAQAIAAVAVTPSATAPTDLAASATASGTGFTTISGSFTAAAITAPTGYVVVRTTANSQPNLADNTTYTLGVAAGIGYIEYVNTVAGGWSSTGLTACTPYYYWVFSYNTGCSGSIKYSTSATPATGTTNCCPTFNSTISIGGLTTTPGSLYPTITAALSVMNTCGITQPTVLELNSSYDYTAETYPITLNTVTGQSSSNTITIRPAAGVTASIISSNTTATIDINAGNYWIIDGRQGGTGSTVSLTISNTSTATGGAAIRLINDAQNNNIEYITAKSAFSSGTTGTIVFSTAATLGNNNNTVQYSNIDGGAGNTASPSNGALNGIYSSGTSTVIPNTGNIIDHNNIYDQFVAIASGNTNAILLAANSSAWTITNNRIYQTAARVATSGNLYRGIQISTVSGGGYTITGNIIGFASSTGTGTMTYSGSAGRISAIDLSMSTVTASNIQGNTVGGISLTTSSGSGSTFGVFTGIWVSAGTVNVGTIVPNIIGAATGTGAITVTSSNTGALIQGISIVTTGTAIVQANTINAINTGGTTNNGYTGYGINGSGSGAFTVSNNTIGGSSADAIRIGTSGTTTGANSLYGIYVSTTGTQTISGNTVNNLSAFSSNATTSYINGITTSGASASAVTLNTVSNLTTNSLVSTFYGIQGIVSNNAVSGQTISQNNIFALRNTSTSSNNINGLRLDNSTASGTVSNNKIYDLTSVGTGSPTLDGIENYFGSWTIQNNMIAITNGSNTNAVTIRGIEDEPGTAYTTNLYYNSIYIGGTASTGLATSECYNRATTYSPTVVIKDNIFVNARTGGTGVQYAVTNGTTTSGWTGNYNVFNAPTTTIGLWNGSTKTFATWQAVAGDANSLTGITNTSGNYVTFATPASGDLHVTPGLNCAIDGAGTAIGGITLDYDGDTRATPPDIGADEFTSVAPAIPSVTGTIAICANTTTTLTASGASGASFAWYTASSNGTLLASTAAYTTPSISTTTHYYVQQTIGTCTSARTDVTVTVNPITTGAVLSGTQTICNGSTANLVVTITGGTSPYSVVYTDGTTPVTVNGYTSGSNIPVTPIANTTYSLMSVTSAGSPACAGTGNSGTPTVTVSQPPTTSTNGGPKSGCKGTTGPALGGVAPTTGTGTWTCTAFPAGGSISDITFTSVNTGNTTPIIAAGATTGDYTLTWTIANAPCTASASSLTLTVGANANAGTITGLAIMCPNTTQQFSTNGDAGGVWSSTATGVATVSSTGIVTVVGQGTTTIKYTVSTGCNSPVVANYVVNVPLLDYVNIQSPFSGTICSTGTFDVYGQVYEPGVTEAAGAGAGITAELGWSTNNTNPSTWTNWQAAAYNGQGGTGNNNDEYKSTLSGIFTPGTTVYYAYRYTFGGCYQYGGTGGTWASGQSGVITVRPDVAVGAISGTTPLCISATPVTFTNPTAVPSNGTVSWSSSAPAVASVNSATGAVTALSAGSTVITYTITGGCGNTTVATTFNLTVSPSANAGSITGVTPLCFNAADQQFSSNGDAGGTWTSTNTAVATVNSTGLVHMVGQGTTTIKYTVSTGCNSPAVANYVVTVEALDYVNLQSPPGGAICSTGSFNAYGQVYEPGITPGAGQGSGITAQIGWSTTNTDPGTWTNWASAGYNAAQLVNVANNDEYYASIGTGFTPGTTYYYTFRYSLHGCGYQYGGYSASGGGTWDGVTNVSGVLVINPNANAGTISGTTPMCSGNTATFTTTGTGGSWSSDNTSVATVNSSTGVVTAVANGTAHIKYTVSTGCAAPSIASYTLTVDLNTWTAAASTTDWFTDANWTCGKPTPTSDIKIPASISMYPNISTGTARAHNITIASGASLTVSGAGIFGLYGDISNSGIFDLTDGTLALDGSGQQISGSSFKDRTIRNLVDSASASLTSATNDTLNITGIFSFGNKSGDPAATFNTNDNLTLRSTATTTASVADITNNGTTAANSIVGNANVERYIKTLRKWEHLAVNTIAGTNSKNSFKENWMENQNAGTHTTPSSTGYGMWITDAAGTPSFDSASFTPTIKYWNNSISAYTGISSVNMDMRTAAANNAYMTFVRGDRSCSGSNADQVPTVLRTFGKLVQNDNLAGGHSIAANGITAVGNPYASAIDLSQMTNTTTGNLVTVIIWDPNASGQNLGAFKYFSQDRTGSDLNFYAVSGSPAGSYPSGYGYQMNTIESGQAFYIQGQGTVNSVSFPEVSKTPMVRTMTFAPGNVQKLSGLLSLNNNGTLTGVDGISVFFKNGYNTAVDGDDAKKLQNTNENISVKEGTTLLAVDARALPDDYDTIKINMATLRASGYRWRFDLANMDQPGRTAFLVDQYTQTETALNLTGSNTYDFNVVNIPGAYATNRFYIVFRPATVVPVTLTSISATRLADKTVIVKWHAENEIAINHYELQRSGNGSQFISIASDQSPTNNAGGSASYSKIDLAPLSGDNYYRIKAISNNGHLQYSAIVKVDPIVKDASISIYPNPISDRVMNLKFAGETPGKYQLQFSDKAGRTVYTSTVTITDGNEVKSLNIGDGLRSGGYDLLIIGADGKKRVIQIVLE